MENSRGNQLPGHRFCPMDDELVLFYLKPMLSGQNVPGRNRVVFDCDLYSQQEPWEIWEAFKTRRPHDLRLNKDIYFFTQHKKMSSTDKRVRRNVGSGTWKGDDSGKPVRSVETGRVVGLKKRYTYKNEDSVHNGCWILHEFYLDQSLRDKKHKVKDYVLCLLRKNGEPKTKIEKKRKQREEEEVLDNNYAFDDGENSNMEQEEFHEPQAKRQRTVPSIDNAPLTMPSEDDAAFVAELEESLECFKDDNAPPTVPSEDDAAFAAALEESLECFEDDNAPLTMSSEDDAAFAAELEESLECFEDDNAPSEAHAIGFQVEENGGQQPLAAEVQAGPSFGDDHGIFNMLQGEDFLLEEMLEQMGIEKEEPVLNGVSSNIDVAEDVVNSTLVEVPTDEQQKTADKDCSDWLESINFSPKENNFFWSEMQWCS
ncbi:NAC domain-containing protein 2-like [Rosa rugosa]|uniref:NAC domain-containing protein 2-like n=1 Tax=Rosa rugosa TaxID=74645 RepID=UPI002B40FD25|nr:NAC domain-containing protein 2-like [Rosa rugosa]